MQALKLQLCTVFNFFFIPKDSSNFGLGLARENSVYLCHFCFVVGFSPGLALMCRKYLPFFPVPTKSPTIHAWMYNPNDIAVFFGVTISFDNAVLLFFMGEGGTPHNVLSFIIFHVDVLTFVQIICSSNYQYQYIYQ